MYTNRKKREKQLSRFVCLLGREKKTRLLMVEWESGRGAMSYSAHARLPVQ